MNTGTKKAVTTARMESLPRRAPLGLFLAVCLLCLPSIQCVEVKGGAAEFSWVLRSFEGESLECADTRVEAVRLCWEELGQSTAGGCRPGNFATFACEDGTGVTSFEIPEGRVQLFAEPLCEDGLPASSGSFQAPSPIVRDVIDGQVVTLDSLLLVVTDTSCGEPGCTCVR